jgi:hypothetical protein
VPRPPRWLALLLLAACGDPHALDGWSHYVAPDGSFEVALPAEPVETLQTVESRFGTLDLRVVSAEPEGPERAYFVIHGEHPAAIVAQNPTEQRLDGVRDALASTFDGRVLEEHDYSLEGRPGRALRMTSATGEASVLAWIVLDGRRVYEIVAVTSPEDADTPDIERFRDSFHLRTER